jgi:hypothetical protein
MDALTVSTVEANLMLLTVFACRKWLPGKIHSGHSAMQLGVLRTGLMAVHI